MTGVNRRPQLSTIAPAASPEEVAAVTAALSAFMRDTAPVIVPEAAGVDGRWRRIALAEGVRRQPLSPARWE